MRELHVWATSVLLFSFAFTQPCHAMEWKEFDDPKSVLLIDHVAKSIGELAATEKAAAVKRLHESLNSNDVEIRRRAALTLDRLGDKGGVPTLIADLPKATGRDRDNIAVALRILKDERAIPVLREVALKDKSPYVRGIGLAALGELKATQAYDEIVALTKDNEREGGEKSGTLNCVQILPAEMACYALGAMGEERAVPVLIELLSDKDLQRAAQQALRVLTKQEFGNDAEKWKAWWKASRR
ncbi:MAG TPA: HEAT repeat domain-containing protein [Planctomycetota bacterium]|nr:HEAT repeat domain-containing protein [Planctomycetota bacterium]